MSANDTIQTPPQVVAAASLVTQHLLTRKYGASYTYIAKGLDGCPKSILLCFTGNPDELHRILRAVQAATQEGQ